MKRYTSQTKIPKEWIICPVCDQAYGFINCRVTNHKRSICLGCLGKQKRLSPE